MANATLVVLVLCIFSACQAQLTTPGKHKPLSGSVHNSNKLSGNKIHTLPLQDNEKLLANEDNSHGGYEFAHVVDFNVNFDSWGPATILPKTGDRVWSTTIVSAGALNLGVTFKGFRIPPGGELYIIGANKTRGALTSINNPSTVDGYVTTFPVDGSFLTLEYYQPAAVKALPVLDVAMVAHGYKNILCFQCSGECNINVACDEGYQNQIRSAGMHLTNRGGRFCSGSMVNTADASGDQLFLTAYHCQSATSDLVVFNYQSATCDPTVNGPTEYVVGLLTPLAGNPASDFLLMRIGEPIPSDWNVYLNGISGENVVPKSLTVIHHPSGDVKKITYAYKAGVPAKWSDSEPGFWHWRVPFWDRGTTEPASSGSPLFDQNRRVVGQLHGGPASCFTISYDLFGATWASWENGLGKFLDPSDTGVLLIDGADLNAVRKNKIASI
jgi:lysyl endopeptidase